MTFRGLESICAKLQASLDPCKTPEKEDEQPMDVANSFEQQQQQRKNKRKSAAPIRSTPLTTSCPVANIEEDELSHFNLNVCEENDGDVKRKEETNETAPDSKRARSSNIPFEFQLSPHRIQQFACEGVKSIESIWSQEIVSQILLKPYEQGLEHVAGALISSKNLGNDLPSHTSSVNTVEGLPSPSESISEYDQTINDTSMDNINDGINGNPDSIRSNDSSSGKLRLFKGKQSLFSSGSDSSMSFDSKSQRFPNAEKCGRDTCINGGVRDHYHCTACDAVVGKRDDMIRHLKWHKKRDESLQHGFMRYCPTDSCENDLCMYNGKQTHYHCIRKNCDKVYISTSDVQMHANYHRKDAAIVQEGFQRFRATENCATESCAFHNEKTTHFHCQREGCTFTFKNKADMDKHKSHHQKNDDYSRDGFKKFMKYEACYYADCKFSKQMNHIHCIRSACDYVVHSSSQILSHKRKHQRRLDSIGATVNSSTSEMLPLNFNEFVLNRSDSMHSAAVSEDATHCGTMMQATSSKAFSFSSADDKHEQLDMMKSEDEYECDENENSSADEIKLRKLSAAHEDVRKQMETFDSNANVELSNGTLALSCELETEDEDTNGLTIDESEEVTTNSSWHLENVRRRIFQNVELREKQTTWNGLMRRFTANDRCVPLCDKMYKDHYHCIVKDCTWTARAKDKIREHTRNHFQEEEVTRHIFQTCKKSNTACPLESHLHCLYGECDFISTEKDPFLTRLHHFKTHDLHHSISHKKRPVFSSRQSALETLNGSSAFDSTTLPSLTINSATNGNSEVGAGALSVFSSKRRGRPPKTRDQIIVPRCVVNDEHLLTMANIFEGNLTLDMFLKSSETPFWNGMRLYSIGEACHDELCMFNKGEHYHCCLPRCYYSSDNIDEVNLHVKEFHRNVQIFEGFEYYDSNVNCRRLQCHYNGRNKHYHCVRDNCDYAFLRHNTMRAHIRKHEEDNLRREYFQNKPNNNVAVGSTSTSSNGIYNPQSKQQQSSELKHINSTVRAAGTYFPANTSPPEVVTANAKDLASQLILTNKATNMPLLSLPTGLMQKSVVHHKTEEEIDIPLDLSSRKANECETNLIQQKPSAPTIEPDSRDVIDFYKQQVVSNNNSSNNAATSAVPFDSDVKEAGRSALMACFVHEKGRGFCRNSVSCAYAIKGQEHMHCRLCSYSCASPKSALEHLAVQHNPHAFLPFSVSPKSTHVSTNNTAPLVIIPLATPVTSSVLQQQ